ncbi:MAG TPA: hypothetical protein VF806_08940, partial [Anaerolineaceae bacterium]
MATHLLSLILFIPTAAALVILFIPGDQKKVIRWTALIASLIPLLLSLYAWATFTQPSGVGGVISFQFEERYAWYNVINSTFHIGVDGIALVMVLLTTLLMPLVILASFKIEE